MTTQYNGQAALESIPGVVNIASSSNTSPIVITTSGAHGLSNGDKVRVLGHSTNVTANGIWTILVISSTTFSLTGSTFTAVGGATGTVQSQNISPTQPILQDGIDPLNASSIHAGLQGALDRTSFLSLRIGAYRLAQFTIFGNIPNPSPLTPTGWQGGRTAPNGSWGDNVNLMTQGSQNPLDVVNGDYVDAVLTTSGHTTTAGANNVAIRLAIAFHDYGVAAGSPTAIGGGGVQLVPQAATYAGPLICQAAWNVAIGGTLGQRASIFQQAYGGSATATYDMSGDWIVVVRVWRPQ